MPVHHTGKDLDRGMRGSSALLAAADAVWRVEPARFSVEKMKEDRAGFEVPFVLRRTAVGTDADGDDITTHVVEVGQAVFPAEPSGDAEPKSGARPMTDGTTAFREILARVIELYGTTLSRYKVIPKTAKVVRQTDLKSFPEIEITATTPASRKARIDTLVRELADRGCIHRHKGYVWFDTPHD